MMTPSQLFFYRLKRNVKEQAKAWNSVFDWTVWVYLLVPGILIFGGLYREIWLETPEWAAGVPWLLLLSIVLFLILAFGGRIRVFVDEADRLFLLQQPRWLKQLKRYGMAYSFIMQALRLVLPFLVVLPFLLRVEQMGLKEVGAAFLYSFLFAMLMSMTIHMLTGRLRKWRQVVLEAIVLLIGVVAYLYPMLSLTQEGSIFGAALAGAAVLLLVVLIVCLHKPIHFETEVKNERSARLSSTELLMSQVIERKPVMKLKKPLFMRQSRRLFKKTDTGTILAELRIITFVRSLSMLRIGMGFLSVTTGAMLIVPPSATYAIMGGFLFLIVPWLRTQWEQWRSEEFVSQFPWNTADLFAGLRLSRFWLLLPNIMVWSAVAGFRLLGLWGVLPSMMVCVLVWWGVHAREWRRPVHKTEDSPISGS
ncbi:ABC transporter permease [Paenibacillus sp. NPDC057967]|uniref:ABC transporter permease n=1 Tax=Paenibacillus sp. NPDC057967 TaxID=3346293 RepID=UPI0036DEC95B